MVDDAASDASGAGGFCFCYVTVGSHGEAVRIGRALVEERLVACANVMGGVTSTYWWAGSIEQADEAVLVVKTRVPLVERLTARVIGLHSYDCPCVVALPIRGGNPDYLAWIAAETT